MASGSGSATGNPRNKVALQPGHSLMDWIRLGNSGVDLSGTKGAFLEVNKALLEKHNTQDDAWICIRGKVYNVTRYMDFHPGGPEELMKGVGKDATNLFQSVHPWVNYESILQKCLVGRLVNVIDVQIFDKPSAQASTTEMSVGDKPQELNKKLEFDWFEQINHFTVVINRPLLALKKLQVSNLDEGEVWIWIEGQPVVGWQLPAEVTWPPRIDVLDFRVEVRFVKSTRSLWSSVQGPLIPSGLISPSPPPSSVPVLVHTVNQVTHNVFLIGLSSSTRVHFYIPIGHHVQLKATIKGVDVERNYTPVIGLGEDLEEGVLWFLIKCYPDGLFSSWITSLKTGDSLFMSSPVGTFSVAELHQRRQLVLFAAGTGLTPMLRIIRWAIKLRCDRKVSVKLVFFNKSEKDIIWREQLEKLSSYSDKFSVQHVLSEPDSTWQGHRGFVTLQMLQSFLPDFNSDLSMEYFAAVCGPISFTQLTERYLKEMGYTSDHYFCFKG